MSGTRRLSHDDKVSFRRQRVLTWAAIGRSTHDMAVDLEVNEITVKRDLAFLKDMAKQELQEYIQERLPFEYVKSLAVLDHVKKRAIELSDNSPDDRNKITALRLVCECEVARARLLSEGEGLLAVRNLQQRVDNLASFQFQEKLRQHIQIAR